MILALPDVREHDYSPLQHFLVGAAPTSLEKLKEAITVFGPVMMEAFGQSEAPASVTAKAPWDYINKDGNINEKCLASIGRPCVNSLLLILASPQLINMIALILQILRYVDNLFS